MLQTTFWLVKQQQQKQNCRLSLPLPLPLIIWSAGKTFCQPAASYIQKRCSCRCGYRDTKIQRAADTFSSHGNIFCFLNWLGLRVRVCESVWSECVCVKCVWVTVNSNSKALTVTINSALLSSGSASCLCFVLLLGVATAADPLLTPHAFTAAIKLSLLWLLLPETCETGWDGDCEAGAASDFRSECWLCVCAGVCVCLWVESFK